MRRVWEKSVKENFSSNTCISCIQVEHDVKKRHGKSISSLGNLTNNLGALCSQMKYRLSGFAHLWLRRLDPDFVSHKIKIIGDPSWWTITTSSPVFSHLFATRYSFVQRIWMISSSLDGACFWRSHGIWAENFSTKTLQKQLFQLVYHPISPGF